MFGFEIASAALLYRDSTRSVDQCSSRAVRFQRVLHSIVETNSCSSGHIVAELGPVVCLTSSEEDELSEATDSLLLMAVEDDSVAELAASGNVMCCRVAYCVDGVLVAAVTNWADAIMLLDAISSQIIYKFRFNDFIYSVAAFQREDGRFLVCTGDRRGVIRIQLADSGPIIGQWQALRDIGSDSAISFKARKVMGAYGRTDGGLWIGLSEKEGPG
jgi:hypothetical protein